MIPIYKDGSLLFSILEMALYICFNAGSFYYYYYYLCSLLSAFKHCFQVRFMHHLVWYMNIYCSHMPRQWPEMCHFQIKFMFCSVPVLF